MARMFVNAYAGSKSWKFSDDDARGRELFAVYNGQSAWDFDGDFSLLGAQLGRQVLTVDAHGDGQFPTIKEACDFAAANRPPADDFLDSTITPPETAQGQYWRIVLTDGTYYERAFTVPDNTLIAGPQSHFGHSAPYPAKQRGARIVFKDDSEGDMITLRDNTGLSDIEILLELTTHPLWSNLPTGNAAVIGVNTTGTTESDITISRCRIALRTFIQSFAFHCVRINAPTDTGRSITLEHCHLRMEGANQAAVHRHLLIDKVAGAVNLHDLRTSSIFGKTAVGINLKDIFTELRLSDVVIDGALNQMTVSGSASAEMLTLGNIIDVVGLASTTTRPVPTALGDPGVNNEVRFDSANDTVYVKEPGAGWRSASLVFANLAP